MFRYELLHPDLLRALAAAAVVVATGEQRVYANLLLTIGVRQTTGVI